MTDRIDALCTLQETALAQLRALQGRFWKAVEGEFHSQYNEMPMWVLLYDDSDIGESHDALCGVLYSFMAEMEPINFTAAYYTADAALLKSLEFLNDNAEIMAARGSKQLGRWVDTELKSPMRIFSDQISGKRP